MKHIGTFEDLLDSLGGFGLFQIIALLAIYYPEIPGGTISILPVYVGANPENITCISNGTEVILNDFSNDMCICEESLSTQHESIVSEWLLFCNQAWVSDFITSIQMVGYLIGGIVGSQISDWIGRKKSFYFSCGLFAIAALSSSIAPNPIFYAIARFLVGFGISSYIAIANIYAIEFLPSKQRYLVGSVGPWGIGIMLIALFAYFCPTWRLLSAITSLPAILIFLSIPFLPESPRWLLQNGRTEEALEVLQKIGRWNKAKGEVNIKIVLGVIGGHCTKTSMEPTVGRAQIFRIPALRRKLLLFVGTWFAVSAISNGLSFNVKNLDGDPYLNLVWLGVVSTFGYPTSAYFNEKLGRKLAMIIYTGISSVALLSILALDLNAPFELGPTIVKIIALSAQFFNCGAFSAVKCFTAESFPTSVRSNAIGICSLASALGAILAPQIVFLGSHFMKSVPFYALGSLGLVSIIFILFLEDTKGKPINESMESLAEPKDAKSEESLYVMP